MSDRNPADDRTFNHRISIVMITRDRGAQIRTALEHLVALPERPDIIVVDNGSSDNTADIACGTGSAVKVITLDKNLGAAGRNVGVSRASTPYVAFSDDDSWWAPGALRRAADLFDLHPDLGLIAARILVGPDEHLEPLCQVLASSPVEFSNGSKVGIPVVGFAACGAIVRREAFLQARGFEARLGVGGEEHILALDLLRNGWQLAYVEEIIAHHHPSPVREPARRRRVEARNALWSAWLRRPAASAFAETQRIMKLSLRESAYRLGLIEAISGLPWVLAERDPVPDVIDRQVIAAEKIFHRFLQLSSEKA